MNKTELIMAVAEKANISKKDADTAVNAVIDTIVETLAKDCLLYTSPSPRDS